MSEYEAMKKEIARLQDKNDELTHDLTIARETITDVARVRDDFFESLSARDADVDRLERERDEWKDKFEIADQVVKDYRNAFGLKEGQSGYDLIEIHKSVLRELKALNRLREDDIVSFNARIAELENQLAAANTEAENQREINKTVARSVWEGSMEGLQDTRDEMISLKTALRLAPHPPRRDSYEDFQKFHEEYSAWWQSWHAANPQM